MGPLQSACWQKRIKTLEQAALWTSALVYLAIL
jgi:hypothetical protein